MDVNRSALIVVDMQLVAFDGEVTQPIASGEALLKKAADLIEVCRAKSIPVIYLQTRAMSGQAYAEDVHGWEIHPDLAPQEDEQIFFKFGPSGFENPKLAKHLNASEIQSLIVCGTWSEGCVAFTCGSGLELGYEVVLVADGHGTVRELASDAALVVEEQNTKLKQQGARVLNSADLFG